MRTLVVGAGATGGFFGAHLHEAGRDVTFLVRPRRAEVLRERGLRITGTGPDIVVTPKLVTASEVDGPYDLVLLSVKATALTSALKDLTTAVGTRTTVVPFLNGMAHLDALNDAYGREVVLGGVVRVLTTLSDDGDIVQLAQLADITVGEQDGARSERLARVAAVLGEAGFDFAVSDDILGAMWHKWVFISTLGALNTLARGAVGEAVAVPGGDTLGRRLAAEGASVAAAAGHPVPQSTLDGIGAFTSRAGSADTASLYRDLAAGRPTEVEQILGDLTARARGFRVDTPLLDLATLQLRAHENRLRA